MTASLKSISAALLMVLCSGSFAQNSGTQNAPPATKPTGTAATPAQTTTSPAGTTTPAQTTAPTTEAKTAAQRHGAPQAKTKEELAAYQTAAGQADLNAALTAADQFSEQYPQSELRYLIYAQLMQKFYTANQPAKVIDVGHKVLSIEPEDTMALIMVATAIAETTHDTDLDQAEKYAEAMKDAESAVKNIDSGLVTPPTMPPEQVAAAKRELVSMAHAAMGYVEMNRKNYGLSEQHFKDAIAANPDQPDATNYLRLAVAQDNQKKYNDALTSVDKALQLSQAQNNAQIMNIAKNEKDRLTKLASAAKPATTAPPKQ
jgi:tetratricopeptide (TPR) repeat protein